MKAQIEHLEQENEKLKKDIAWYKKEEDSIRDVVRENRKLKENIAWYEKEEDRLREENEKLIENEKYRYSRCMKAERKLTAFENEDLTEDL